MTERIVRETNDATYIRGHWVGGQRFRRPNGKIGWYVLTFSDSFPVAEYWIVERRFYKALIRWVEARTFDIETIPEGIEIGPERKSIMLEAIRRWENKLEECGFEDTQSNHSQYSSLHFNHGIGL